MHVPVLLQESIDGLNLKEGDMVVDATINAAGHSVRIAEIIGKTGRLVGIDLDSAAIARAGKVLAGAAPRVDLVCGSYVDSKEILAKLGIASANAFLFDFGLSSDQYESGRGFSFQKEEPLVMTFKAEVSDADVTASQVVNNWEKQSLETIISGFGEERYAGRIARAITEARAVAPIETTEQLREIIFQAVPVSYRHGRIDPATRTFQAIRIAVNRELESVDKGLRNAFDLLLPGGRIGAISFHSLEDRIVKRLFRELSDAGLARIVTKKPLVAGLSERKVNPRARSAKLRILERI